MYDEAFIKTQKARVLRIWGKEQQNVLSPVSMSCERGCRGREWCGERWLEAGSWELAKASLTVDIQEVLCHDHWPLVNGFA